MVPAGTALRPALTRDEAGTLLGHTMGLVAVTAGFFALGAYLGRNVAYGWGWLFFIAALLALFAMNAAAQRSEQAAITLLFGFGVLFGLAVAPTVAYYASADPQAVCEAGGATALFVAGFGSFGYATRRDLAPLARAFFWALLALIVFWIVAIFVQIPNGALIYSIVASSSSRGSPHSTSSACGRARTSGQRRSSQLRSSSTSSTSFFCCCRCSAAGTTDA